jgi:hypothetical protein
VPAGGVSKGALNLHRGRSDEREIRVLGSAGM